MVSYPVGKRERLGLSDSGLYGLLELLSALIPFVGMLLGSLGYDPEQPSRYRLVVWQLLGNLVGEGFRIYIRVHGIMARQKLIICYAEGIYVCSGIYLCVGDVAQYLLGCGILWRPDETVARIFIAAVHPGYSQIHQFDHTAILEHDVGWLDVAMYHPARVQICEGIKHTAYLVAYLLDTVFGRKVAELRTHMLVERKA